MYAIYARQSINKEDSISIESQIKYCEYEVKGKPYKVYSDKGFSGKNTNRPQFQTMINDVEKGLISHIVVYKLDRISRSIIDFASLIDLLTKYNVEFVSSSEKFDTSTPMGRAMLHICIVFAQLERETIAKRVSDSYYIRSNNGFYMGGTLPFGFDIEKTKIGDINTSKYSINPFESMIVYEMFSLYGNYNYSYSQIADYFNKNNIKNRKNTWSKTTIANRLHNPIYVRADEKIYNYYLINNVEIINPLKDFNGTKGCYLFRDYVLSKGSKINNRRLVIAPHEGIIDSDLFLKCNPAYPW